MTDVVEKQEVEDQFIKHILKMHLREHIDVYPEALMLLNTVLKAARESPSCGGSEPDTLRDLTNACRKVLYREDPHSAGFIEVD